MRQYVKSKLSVAHVKLSPPNLFCLYMGSEPTENWVLFLPSSPFSSALVSSGCHNKKYHRLGGLEICFSWFWRLEVPERGPGGRVWFLLVILFLTCDWPPPHYGVTSHAERQTSLSPPHLVRPPIPSNQGPTLCHCYSVAELYLTLCISMDCNIPGFLDLHHLPEFAQIHVH